MAIIAVDFETEAIENRPDYPPKPVGVSIKWNGKHRYYSWGHPTGNNCTKAEAKKVLKEVFTKHVPLFHNAAFDIAVAVKHMGCKWPKEFHDTLFSAYLYDPRSKSLSLKPMAEMYLDMPPEEQDAVRDWILKNIFEPQGMKPTKKNSPGAYICKAPGKLVAKYAIGDTVRTEKLHNFFMPYVEEMGMREAYDRERACLPIFNEMSDVGIRVNYKKLKRDLKKWEAQVAKWEAWIRKRLKTKDLDIGSSRKLADALEKTKKISHWIMTKPTKTFPQGQRSTKRENLILVCTDKKLVEILGKHSVLNTYIATFAKPWIETSEKHNGRVYPSFNQVRSTDEHGKSMGTRTGRPSSYNPNFLNVPRNQSDPDLPNLRDYLIPDEGYAFLIRDYSQQELRILAHFEEGLLYAAYLEDPTMDAHNWVSDMMTTATHKVYPRPHVKVVNFGVVYGMGKPGVAKKIDGSMDEAAELLNAHRKALPGVKELGKAIQKHCKAGNPIYTWGGREYYAEEPKEMNIGGRLIKKDFYYKQLNYLIQGSAADCTKEAMIRVDKAVKSIGGRIALQVYDELVVCVPIKHIKKGMKLVKDNMESIEFDIPMLSDGKVGRKSWGQATKYKD